MKKEENMRLQGLKGLVYILSMVTTYSKNILDVEG